MDGMIKKGLEAMRPADVRLYKQVFAKIRQEYGGKPGVASFFGGLWFLLDQAEHERKQNAKKLEKDFLLDGQDIKTTWTNQKKGRDS